MASEITARSEEKKCKDLTLGRNHREQTCWKEGGKSLYSENAPFFRETSRKRRDPKLGGKESVAGGKNVISRTRQTLPASHSHLFVMAAALKDPRKEGNDSHTTSRSGLRQKRSY